MAGEAKLVGDAKEQALKDMLKVYARNTQDLKNLADRVSRNVKSKEDALELLKSVKSIRANLNIAKTLLEDFDQVEAAFDALVKYATNCARNMKENYNQIPVQLIERVHELSTALKACVQANVLVDAAAIEADNLGRLRQGSFQFGQDEYSLELLRGGIQHVGADGTVRTLLHDALPPTLNLEDIIRTWGTNNNDAGFDDRDASRSEASSSRAPIRKRTASDGSLKPIDPNEKKPAAPPKARPQSLAPPSSVDHSRSSSRISVANPVSYNNATVRTARYTDSFAGILASYSAAAAALRSWVDDLKTTFLTPAKLDEGQEMVDDIVDDVSQLMKSLHTPSAFVADQLVLLAATFTEFFENPLKGKVAYFADRSEIEKIHNILFVLHGVINGVIALNIVNHRHSIFLTWRQSQQSNRNSADLSDQVCKVIRLMVVGHIGVGKTSLIRKFCNPAEAHSADIQPTQGIELKISKKKFDEDTLELQILDATGHKQLREAFDQFYSVVDAVILVYDITSSASFGDIHDWMHDLEKYSFSQKVIVANKTDLKSQREVLSWRGQALAEEYHVKHIESSCTNNENIDEIFATVIRQILNAQADQNGNNSDDEADGHTNIQLSGRRPSGLPKIDSNKTEKTNKYTFFTRLQ